MNTVSPEVLAQKRVEALRNKAEMQAAIGARANCDLSRCVLLQIGGNCPKPGSGECPPQAETIQKEAIPQALDDDSVGSIAMDGGGGFVALPQKSSNLQTPITLPPKLKQQLKPRPVVAAKKSPKVEQLRNKNNSGVLAMLGELALMFFGGASTVPAKK